MSPCVKTNIKYPFKFNLHNPETFEESNPEISQRRSVSSKQHSRLNNSELLTNSQISSSMNRSSSFSNALLDEEKKVIHKNLSY